MLNFVLVLFWLFALSKNHLNRYRLINKWLVFAACIVFGMFIEVLQELFTQTRQADIYDVSANLVGSLLGMAVFFALPKHSNK